MDPSTRLQTHDDAKDQSVLKQLVNPGRKNYDETAHGTTATATDSSALGSSSSTSNNQSSLPIRDTTNTNTTSDSNFGRDAAIAGGGAAALGAGGVAANQYSKREHDTTGAGQTDGLADGRTGAQAAQDQSGSHGAGRDAGSASVVNRAHDNDPYKGDTILAGAAGTSSQSRPHGESSLTSGTSAGYNQPTTSSTAGDATSGLTGSSATRTAGVDQPTTGNESHLGRDAGIAGGLAAGAGAGAAYGASRHNNESGVSSTEPLGERSHPLTSGTSHGHINPVGAPEASLRESSGQSGPDSHLGSSHTGVLGSSQHTTSVPSGGVHNNEGTTQLNQAPADVQGATFLDRSFYIGKPGDPVSHGPHVPGEFPAASGEDPHAVSSSTAGTSSIQPTTGATSSDHTGRNTALAGGALGAGALGAGAYASSRDQPSSTTGQSGIGQTTGSATSTQDPAFAHYGRETSAPATSTSTTSGLGSSTADDHHYGRDAAVAGGAGALGAGGVYAATRDHNDPTQASGLTSSSQQPAVTSSQPTSALHSSSTERPAATTVGSATPRSDVAVTGVPATSRDLKTDTTRDETHYGRDAAVAGGVGAAGAGAYAATRDHDDPLNTTHSAYGTEDPNKHNKLHKQSPDEKKLEKEQAKEEKHHEKELEKQHHAAQKQHEKDDKERRHAAEKAEKKHEKEVEKQHEKEEKEKKPSLIDRILHRHKDDKDETTTSSSSVTKSEHEPLHIKENTDNGPLDHPLVTAAGTTTTAGDTTGSSVTPAAYQQGGSNIVKDPHTGLPVDTSKGTGVGGTDGNPNIGGIHSHTGEAGATSGPDWEAIKKSNTPY